jgi:hypothetical protein
MKRRVGCQDRVEADLRCLMCSRVIGQLFGVVWRDSRLQRTSRSMVHLSQFQPSVPGAPSVRFTSRAQLRCPDCRGFGVLEEIVVTPVRESVQLEDGCPIHRERVSGPGRRPRGCQCRDLRVAA